MMWALYVCHLLKFSHPIPVAGIGVCVLQMVGMSVKKVNTLLKITHSEASVELVVEPVLSQFHPADSITFNCSLFSSTLLTESLCFALLRCIRNCMENKDQQAREPSFGRL